MFFLIYLFVFSYYLWVEEKFTKCNNFECTTVCCTKILRYEYKIGINKAINNQRANYQEVIVKKIKLLIFFKNSG